MPVVRLCVICGRRHTDAGNYCPEHRPVRRTNRQRRPDYNAAERRRRKACVDAHRAVFGDWCPGWQREPHPSADLTADHVVPVAAGGPENGPLRTLCRSCNSRRQARQ